MTVSERFDIILCMANTFGREFDQARREQGFTSQAQLDAFFAHYDHNTTCPDCAKLDGWVELSDGYQPTKGSCPVDKALYIAYLNS